MAFQSPCDRNLILTTPTNLEVDSGPFVSSKSPFACETTLIPEEIRSGASAVDGRDVLCAYVLCMYTSAAEIPSRPEGSRRIRHIDKVAPIRKHISIFWHRIYGILILKPAGSISSIAACLGSQDLPFLQGLTYVVAQPWELATPQTTSRNDCPGQAGFTVQSRIGSENLVVQEAGEYLRTRKQKKTNAKVRVLVRCSARHAHQTKNYSPHWQAT